MMTIEDRLAVEQLQTRYVDALDEERFEDWPELFTERCLYKIIAVEDHKIGRLAGFVFCDSRGMLIDRISSMRRANIYERHTYRHMVCALSVEAHPDGGYTASSNYLVVRIMQDGAQSIFSTGRYRDRIVDQDGTLLFSERLVLCDASRLDSLLVIPL